MISIQQARATVLDRARPLVGRQVVPVAHAVGRRLLQDVRADGDLPPFDRVTMDGYAVRASDLAEGVVLPVAGEVAAGSSSERALPPGAALAVMTGAPLPPGADAVVQVEWTEPAGERAVKVLRTVEAGAHVAPQGEDVRAGDVLLRKGEVVTLGSLSLLLASGAEDVAVVRRPRVAVLTSGDELVPPGARLRRGQIRESNGPVLAALLEAAGADLVERSRERDDEQALTERLARVLEVADLLVLTGGSSVGRYDFSARVLEALGGRCHFDRVAVKPGKPTLFFTRGEALVLCLPGNPVAALMTGLVLACAAVRRLHGEEVPAWTDLAGPLCEPVRRNPARDLLVPVRRSADGVLFRGWHGSGDLACMAGADAFGFLARGEGEAPPGTPVPLFPLPDAARLWEPA